MVNIRREILKAVEAKLGGEEHDIYGSADYRALQLTEVWYWDGEWQTAFVLHSDTEVKEVLDDFVRLIQYIDKELRNERGRKRAGKRKNTIS